MWRTSVLSYHFKNDDERAAVVVQAPCEDACWLSSFVAIMGTADWKEMLEELL